MTSRYEGVGDLDDECVDVDQEPEEHGHFGECFDIVEVALRFFILDYCPGNPTNFIF